MKELRFEHQGIRVQLSSCPSSSRPRAEAGRGQNAPWRQVRQPSLSQQASPHTPPSPFPRSEAGLPVGSSPSTDWQVQAPWPQEPLEMGAWTLNLHRQDWDFWAARGMLPQQLWLTWQHPNPTLPPGEFQTTPSLHWHRRGTHFLTQAVLAGTPAWLPLAQPQRPQSSKGLVQWWLQKEEVGALGQGLGCTAGRQAGLGRGPTWVPRTGSVAHTPPGRPQGCSCKPTGTGWPPRPAWRSVGWVPGRGFVC